MRSARASPPQQRASLRAPRTAVSASEHARALLEPGAGAPLTADDFKRMRRVPQVKTLRRALRLTQEEFALRYRIPLETLRAWELGRLEPDRPASAYLRVIACDPEGIGKMLKGS